MNKLKLLLIISIIFIRMIGLSQLYINEYSCSNLYGYQDNFGATEDWFEIYNAGSSPINLSGYYLSDDASQLNKWQIPNGTGTTISPNGFIKIWASGRDTLIASNLHANFKYAQTKNTPEKIILSSSGLSIIDSLTIQKAQLGHSIGRTTNGGSIWGIYTSPTLAASNTTSTAYERYAATPSMSIDAGFYTSPQNMDILNSEPSSQIYYTTNGLVPNSTSTLYSSTINISSTKIIKAIVVSTNPNVLPSFIEFKTIFINENHMLPVVSIAADSLTELANNIMTKRYIDSLDVWFMSLSGVALDSFSDYWFEPPFNSRWDSLYKFEELALEYKPLGTIEYFGTDKLLKTRSYGNFGKHGQDSWENDQRSIDVACRDEMGYTKELDYRIFKLTDREKFQKIILRASGDDNYPSANRESNEGCAHIRDGYVQNLCKRDNLKLDYRTTERVILYLNGVYWGVYEIREKPVDHDYTDYYYDQGKYDIQVVNVWGETWAEYGDTQALIDWNFIKDYILSNDMSDTLKYNFVDSMYNVKSLVDYVLVNSFTVCTDWLNYNTSIWRGLDRNGEHKKWGYSLWDNDATFGFYINYTGVPDTSAYALPCNAEGLTDPFQDPESHISILNKLRLNPTFNNYYINRQIDLLNTTFSCENMLSYLDSLASDIRPEMPRHCSRWYGTMGGWESNLARLRHFIERRCVALESGLVDCYSLSGPYNVLFTSNFDDVTGVDINSLKIDSLPWSGKFYGGIDTKLELKKYTSIIDTHFIQWDSRLATYSPNNLSANTKVRFNGNDTITARFSTTGVNIEKIEESNLFNVFPTLTNGIVYLEYANKNFKNTSIKIYSNTGMLVYIMNAPNNQNEQYRIELDFNNMNLTNGTYYIQFNYDNNSKVKKVEFIK